MAINNDCKAIHETGLKVLIDIWDSIKSIKDDDKNKSHGGFSPKEFLKNKANNREYAPGKYSSVAKAASNLTLVFPVICSRNISIETASIVNKALEKNDASIMQKIFASWQIADEEIGSVQDYINQFHTNINTRAASLDDVFALTSRLESYGSFDKEVELAFREDAKNLNYILPSDISERSLNEYTVKNGVVSTKVLKEAAVSTTASGNTSPSFPGADLKMPKSKIDSMKTYADYFSKQIPDAEYKKANELMPTPLTVNFQVKEKNGDNTVISGATVGIKSKLYPISSKDIVDHIGEKVQAKTNWLVNFFRATTRETSFFRDFLLAIDKAKIDAMSLSDRKSSTDKMWKVLERRALRSRFKSALNDANSAAAITTLVLSQEEVEYLRKHNNVDIEHISNVVGLFESLNLMCIVIVDETLEVAKFIYDENDPMWETISFTHLERESNDNTYKRVVNLMTKVSK